MNSYHFNNNRKYKKRRSLVVTTITLCIAAGTMAAYLYLNKDADNQKNPSNTTSIQANASTQSNTSADTNNTAAQTAAASVSDKNQTVVETKDHGALPKVGTIEKSGKKDELSKLISDYTKNLPGRYGVTYIDLATGEMVNVNDKVEFIAASTSKLPVNVLLYKKIEEGKIKLDDELVYDKAKKDFEAGTGIIQNSASGTKYTVRETSKLAMRKSDNCGVNMLIRLLGIENVRSYMDTVGGKVHYDNRHRSCPYDMAKIAEDLYTLYLNNEDLYGELINNMENSDWHDRIDAKLPKNIKVAHKIGNQTKTANDVGIIFATHPYVLSIMTENVDFGSACKSIADLSKKIYEFEEGYAAK